MSASTGGLRVLFKGAELGAVGETVAAAGAFAFDNFVHVVNVLHLGMDGALGTDFAAEAAGDAESFDDSNFHDRFHSQRSCFDELSTNGKSQLFAKIRSR